MIRAGGDPVGGQANPGIVSDRARYGRRSCQRLRTSWRLGAVAWVGITAGPSSNSQLPQAPDPATQPEAQAALFQRTRDRVKSLIANKEYQQAQEALNLFKNYKLTPEKQEIVDQLQAQLSKPNKPFSEIPLISCTAALERIGSFADYREFEKLSTLSQ